MHRIVHGAVPGRHLRQVAVALDRRLPGVGRAGQVAPVDHLQPWASSACCRCHAQRLRAHAGTAAPAPMSVGAPIRLTRAAFIHPPDVRRSPQTRRCVSPAGRNRSGRPGTSPGILGRLDEVEQVHVARADHAGLDQPVEVDQAGPRTRARTAGSAGGATLAGLHQRHRLEQLVQRAEAARETHQRDAAHQEVHLAQREVVKLEAQLRRDVRVGLLLVRQHDVQADALARPPRGRRGCRLP
jgi:hypothetical protein